MSDDVHDLAAGYALDALDVRERARFEEHLDGCDDCRQNVASFREAAAHLAFAPVGAEPPPELRGRILSAARAEGQNVVSLQSRRSLAVSLAAAVAVAASAAAVGFGVWAASLHHSLQHEQSVARLLGDPAARRVPVQGAAGSLVVDRAGDAALAVDLPPPPSGKTYEAWVIDGTVRPAGVFSGRTVLLKTLVHAGATVKVTLERSGGVDAPTSTPLLSVRV